MSQNQMIEIRQTESLDLLNFFKILFKGSWLIILCAGLFGSIAFGASYLVKQKWTSEAYFYKPTAPEVGNYYAFYSMYRFVNSTNRVENVDNYSLILDHVYQEFKRQLSSYNTMASFWLNNDYYKQQITGDNTKDQQLLDQLIANTKFIEGNENKNLPDRMILTLDNPKRATELLVMYVNYANLNAKYILYNDLITQWKTLFDQIKAAADFNIKSVSNGQILEGGDWQNKFEMMKSATALDNQFIAYRYLKTPTLQAKTQPDRILWASMAAILGFLFGCALMLSLNSRKIKRRVITTSE